MTTYKGIAAVTQTLGYLAGTGVLAAVPEARVTLSRPEESPPGAANEPRLNIYLIQVLPEPTMRSSDLPTRDDQLHLVHTPTAPVNLRYLLSFFGATEKAHLMLGAVEVLLRAHAVLEPTLINQALANYPELQDSGLAAQVPQVRIVPSMVSLEELSRFWSGFLQMPYTLSTVYEALTVVLTSTELPAAILPVRNVGTPVGSLPPRLDPLPTVQFTTAGAGTVVPLRGTGLAAGQLLEVGDVWVPLASAAGGWQVTLPSTVAAGEQPVRLGNPPPAVATAAPGGAATSAAPAGLPIPGRPQILRIRPELVQATTSGTASTSGTPTPVSTAGSSGSASAASVTVELAPPVRAGQSVVLSLVGTGPATDPVSDSVQVTQTPAATTASLTFPVPPAIGSGQYLTIVEVDGVSTLPTVVSNVYAQPAVSVG